MNNCSLQNKIDDLKLSIRLCIREELWGSSLILIYSLIDIMAWLSRDKEQDETKRGDFINWVKNYIIPNSDFSCKAEDLYGARCSILHSYSAESNLSKKGKAVEVFYTYKKVSKEQLQTLINKQNYKAKAVKIEELYKALDLGSIQFLSENINNKDIQARSQKMFFAYPFELIDINI